jgi:hypothetical protein
MLGHKLPLFGVGIGAAGIVMVVHGLAAEYVYNDPERTDREEEEASKEHLWIVMKGIICIVVAVAGLFFGWFS